jgi:hypothetical protein
MRKFSSGGYRYPDHYTIRLHLEYYQSYDLSRELARGSLLGLPLIDWLQMGKRQVGQRASSCAAAMASMAAPTGRTGSHMPLSGGGCAFLYSYAPTRQVRTAVGPRCHPEICHQWHTICGVGRSIPHLPLEIL